MASGLLSRIFVTTMAILLTGSLLGCTISTPEPSPTPEPTPIPATLTPEPLPTATTAACEPSPIQNSDIGFPEIQATLNSANSAGEVWALLFFNQAIAEQELKIVWKVAGAEGDLTVEARGEDGTVLSPIWGPEMHEGSNWDRPGAEWGTGFNFPSPGCWTLTATRGAVAGAMGLEVLPP